MDIQDSLILNNCSLSIRSSSLNGHLFYLENLFYSCPAPVWCWSSIVWFHFFSHLLSNAVLTVAHVAWSCFLTLGFAPWGDCSLTTHNEGLTPFCFMAGPFFLHWNYVHCPHTFDHLGTAGAFYLSAATRTEPDNLGCTLSGINTCTTMVAYKSPFAQTVGFGDLIQEDQWQSPNIPWRNLHAVL